MQILSFVWSKRIYKYATDLKGGDQGKKHTVLHEEFITAYIGKYHPSGTAATIKNVGKSYPWHEYPNPMQALRLPSFNAEVESKFKCHVQHKHWQDIHYLAKFGEKRCRYLGYLISPDSGLEYVRCQHQASCKPHDNRTCVPDNTQAAGLDRLSSRDQRTRRCWNSIRSVNFRDSIHQ
jgi:hypothetical protein